MKDSRPSHAAAESIVAKLAAVALSLPPWILLAAYIGNGFSLKGCGINPGVFAIPCCICALCSMVSLTLFLILIPFQSVRASHILWAVWAGLSWLCGVFLLLVVWISVTDFS